MHFRNFSSKTNRFSTWVLSSLCFLNCSSQWIGPWSHPVQVSSKSVSKKETNLAKATVIWKHSSSEWIYCFQSSDEKKKLILSGSIFPKCSLLSKPTSGNTIGISNCKPCHEKNRRTPGHGFDLESKLPLVHEILMETAAREMVKGKNCPYMAIRSDTRLINSPFFPRHIIIYLICQIWYLTTLSSEQLTNPGKVCLVNHKERWQVSQVSSVVKRREA